MLEQLQYLSGSADPAISSRAQMAMEITNSLQNGDISNDEYRELMLDLVRSDRLDAECSDLETKTMLVTVVYAMTQVV